MHDAIAGGCCSAASRVHVWDDRAKPKSSDHRFTKDFPESVRVLSLTIEKLDMRRADMG